jgi:hypothetical protein
MGQVYRCLCKRVSSPTRQSPESLVHLLRPAILKAYQYTATFWSRHEINPTCAIPTDLLNAYMGYVQAKTSVELVTTAQSIIDVYSHLERQLPPAAIIGNRSFIDSARAHIAHIEGSDETTMSRKDKALLLDKKNDLCLDLMWILGNTNWVEGLLRIVVQANTTAHQTPQMRFIADTAEARKSYRIVIKVGILLSNHLETQQPLHNPEQFSQDVAAVLEILTDILVSKLPKSEKGNPDKRILDSRADLLQAYMGTLCLTHQDPIDHLWTTFTKLKDHRLADVWEIPYTLMVAVDQDPSRACFENVFLSKIPKKVYMGWMRSLNPVVNAAAKGMPQSVVQAWRSTLMTILFHAPLTAANVKSVMRMIPPSSQFYPEIGYRDQSYYNNYVNVMSGKMQFLEPLCNDPHLLKFDWGNYPVEPRDTFAHAFYLRIAIGFASQREPEEIQSALNHLSHHAPDMYEYVVDRMTEVMPFLTTRVGRGDAERVFPTRYARLQDNLHALINSVFYQKDKKEDEILANYSVEWTISDDTAPVPRDTIIRTIWEPIGYLRIQLYRVDSEIAADPVTGARMVQIKEVTPFTLVPLFNSWNIVAILTDLIPLKEVKFNTYQEIATPKGSAVIVAAAEPEPAKKKTEKRHQSGSPQTPSSADMLVRNFLKLSTPDTADASDEEDVVHVARRMITIALDRVIHKGVKADKLLSLLRKEVRNQDPNETHAIQFQFVSGGKHRHLHITWQEDGAPRELAVSLGHIKNNEYSRHLMQQIVSEVEVTMTTPLREGGS